MKRGTVLGLIDQLPEGGNSAGMYIVAPVDSTKSDGSQKPFAVLADPEVDANNSDVRATGYVGGEFNREALIFGGTDTIVTHELALNNIGIFTKRVVG